MAGGQGLRGRVATAVAGVATAVLTLTVGAAPPAAAAAPGGPIHFHPQGPVRVYNSQETVDPPPIAALAGHYVRLLAYPRDEGGSGTVTLGPCGGSPDTVLVIAGHTEGSLQYIAPGDCVTRTGGPLRLIIDSIATVGPDSEDGTRYFDLPSSPVLFDGTLAGAATTVIPLTAAQLPDGTTHVAVQLDGYSLDSNGVGLVTMSPCGAPQGSTPDLVPNGDFWVSDVSYVPVVPGQDVCVYSYGAAELTVTVLGYFTDAVASGGDTPPTLVYDAVPPPRFAPQAPQRVLDTRTGIGVPAGKLAAGQTVHLDVSPYIEPLTTAVVLNVTATATGAWGYVTVYPCDAPQPATSNVNFDAAGLDVPNLVTAAVADDGTVCLYTSAATHLLADLAGTYEWGTGQGFTALDPARILDTRGGAPVGAGQVRTLQVTGAGGVAAGASAVTLNLTAVDAQGWGYLTAYPCDAPQPNASNVNYVAGQTVPNLVTVKLSAAGTVCIYTYAATHLLADVAGYYSDDPAGAGFETWGPDRLVDTRQGGSPVPAGVGIGVQITEGSAAEAALTAVVTNLTATGTGAAGYLTAFPCAAGRPNASNVNYRKGQTIANQAVTKLAADGSICVSTSADTDVIVDLFGYFTTAPNWVQYLR